jgi:hypothetical protein
MFQPPPKTPKITAKTGYRVSNPFQKKKIQIRYNNFQKLAVKIGSMPEQLINKTPSQMHVQTTAISHRFQKKLSPAFS